MRVMRSNEKRGVGAILVALAALPAQAASPAVAADVAHQISALWIPATAYGLTLIASFGNKQN